MSDYCQSYTLALARERKSTCKAHSRTTVPTFTSRGRPTPRPVRHTPPRRIPGNKLVPSVARVRYTAV